MSNESFKAGGIVNYAYYQAEGISIGSGTIESTIKQIGRRIKISGSQRRYREYADLFGEKVFRYCVRQTPSKLLD